MAWLASSHVFISARRCFSSWYDARRPPETSICRTSTRGSCRSRSAWRRRHSALTRTRGHLDLAFHLLAGTAHPRRSPPWRANLTSSKVTRSKRPGQVGPSAIGLHGRRQRRRSETRTCVRTGARATGHQQVVCLPCGFDRALSRRSGVTSPPVDAYVEGHVAEAVVGAAVPRAPRTRSTRPTRDHRSGLRARVPAAARVAATMLFRHERSPARRGGRNS